MPPDPHGDISSEAGSTVRSVLTTAIGRLEAAGVDTPHLDAELLLAYVLGQSRTWLLAHPFDPLPPTAEAAFCALLRRREAREPLPYLLGKWEFMGLSFEVGPAALIPRPETETLVQLAVERLPPSAQVLDVGAGTGCIAIAVARLRNDLQVVALEPSLAAAELARRNAERLEVIDRVRVVNAAFPKGTAALGPLDAILSNPPYIPAADVEHLAPELRLYEPRVALDGGPDGLSLLRALVDVSPRLLTPAGMLAMEVMQGQAEQVADLLRAHGGWSEPELVPDLAGIPRIVAANRVP